MRLRRQHGKQVLLYGTASVQTPKWLPSRYHHRASIFNTIKQSICNLTAQQIPQPGIPKIHSECITILQASQDIPACTSAIAFASSQCPEVHIGCRVPQV